MKITLLDIKSHSSLRDLHQNHAFGPNTVVKIREKGSSFNIENTDGFHIEVWLPGNEITD